MKKDNIKNKGQRSTYSVIFYLKKSSPKKNGLCPIMGRITIDGQIKAFSLSMDADPNLWDSKENRMIGKSRISQQVNNVIEKYIVKIDNYYDNILYNHGFISAELVKNALDGIDSKETDLLKLFRKHNEEYLLRVGVDRAKGTYIKYLRSHDRLLDFIRYKYGKDDVSLCSLTLSFIESYEYYLRIERNMANNTISDLVKHLQKIINLAINQGTLRKNPFLGYKQEKSKMVCRYLQMEELERIMKTYIPSNRLCYIRDIFVFACFTGLAYVDLCNLSEDNLKTGEDGRTWIIIERQKTKTECNIPLMKLPYQIIEKYRSSRIDGKIFKAVSSGKLSKYFRKLEKLCNVPHISFHMGRHTFATQIMLFQGVTIASISKLLGHASIKTTQIYAKITSQKVNADMKILSEQMKGKYRLPEGNMDKSA